MAAFAADLATARRHARQHDTDATSVRDGEGTGTGKAPAKRTGWKGAKGRTGPRVRFDARLTFFASLWPPSRFLARTMTYFYDNNDNNDNDDKNTINHNTTTNVNNDVTNDVTDSTDNTAERAVRSERYDERGERANRPTSTEDTGNTGPSKPIKDIGIGPAASTGDTVNGTVYSDNRFWSFMSFLTDPSEEEVAAVVRTNSL